MRPFNYALGYNYRTSSPLKTDRSAFFQDIKSRDMFGLARLLLHGISLGYLVSRFHSRAK